MSSGPLVFDLSLPPLALERGGLVGRHIVRGWWWGPASGESALRASLRTVEAQAWRPSPTGAAGPTLSSAPLASSQIPVVLVVHALTGDMRAGGPSGWWEPVIGPGRVVDPRHVHVLCLNNLGSCYGTSGPMDLDFPRRDAPEVTTWDQAASLLAALDALGVGRVALATGGSLGGMICLALACLAPARFERIMPIAAAAASSAWVLGLNHLQRQLIARDLEDPRGVELARQLAMLSYRAEPGLDETQGRRRQPTGEYRIQTYLEHQGQKLQRRFDARAYLAQASAMDHHDLSRPPPGRDAPTWRGLGEITAATLAVGIDTDVLFFPRHMEAIAAQLARAEYAELRSPHGHDAFLIEWDQLAALLARALALRSPA